MPEGDTVYLAGKTMNKALAGAEVDVDFRVPQLAERGMRTTYLTTATHGKHLLTRFASGDTLHAHFKMEGAYHLYRPGERWRRPTHQARVVITGADWTAVGFSLGVTELVRTDVESDVVGHLGPDLLDEQWDDRMADEAVRRLAADPARAAHEALLDQRNLAGLGNMYVGELCFLLGLHPRSPIGEAGDLHRVVERGRRLLVANKDRPEQSTTGDLRRGRDLWVYGRGRKTCYRCGTRIRLEQLGEPGKERPAYFCPRCQPGEPASRAERRPSR